MGGSRNHVRLPLSPSSLRRERKLSPRAPSSLFQDHGLLHRRLLALRDVPTDRFEDEGLLSRPAAFSFPVAPPSPLTHPSLPSHQILSIYDLPHTIAIKALRRLYKDAHPNRPPPPRSTLEAVVELIGGRTSYLNRCARSKDMMEEALFMVRSEREFLMSKLGLM